MQAISVLFVDDEEDIRHSFRDRFEDDFAIRLASNGTEALDALREERGINVVVTDIRMPSMNGLEMIQKAKGLDPDLGFIVVSGHGDTDDVITALRLGARNFIRKPYSFAELEEAITVESGRYRLIKEERARLERERATDEFLVSVEGMTYLLPTRLEWVNPFTFRLMQVMEAVGLCSEENRFNIALGLIEIVTNAIEHGNLGIAGEEKRALKAEGEAAYHAALAARVAAPEFRDRKVKITASVTPERAMVVIEDEGDGFDYRTLPDPTDPENLFLPSGRGILLARSFLDEVIYTGRGNVVTLIKHRQRPPE